MGGIFGSDKEGFSPSFNFDLSAPPTPSEKSVYDQLQVVIECHPKIITQMQAYKGCTEYIRVAVSQPKNEEAKQLCWAQLSPSVEVLKEFYLHAENLAKVFPVLLEALCSPPDVEGAFSSQQALTKQMVDVFDFCIAYDELKMGNPAISNDFSYYRRQMSAMRMSSGGGGDTAKTGITDEMANKMSLFYAFPTPMLNLVKNCIQSDKLKIDKERLQAGLALVANVCYNLVEKRKITNSKLLMFCLRAAVGATILVDSLYEPGIFNPKAGKKSPVSAKYALTILKNFIEPECSTVHLINALKYNTKEADAKYKSTLFE